MNNASSARVRTAAIGRRRGRIVGMLGFFAIAGCGQPTPTAQVRGTVVQDGRPLSGVMVSFLPDPLKGARGRATSAMTDGEGRYRLDTDDPGAGAGTAVGWHRVVVKDVAQEIRRQDQPTAAPRVPLRFTTAGHTPLAHQIRPGPQVIDLDIPAR